MPPPTPRTMRFRYSRCIGLPFGRVNTRQSNASPGRTVAQKRWAKIAQRPHGNSGAHIHRGAMSIRDWPAAERPREKLLERGASSLSDAELLAIFLRTGVSGKSAVDLARHLLSQFGSLRALLEANLTAFSNELGLGPAKFAQ